MLYLNRAYHHNDEKTYLANLNVFKLINNRKKGVGYV